MRGRSEEAQRVGSSVFFDLIMIMVSVGWRKPDASSRSRNSQDRSSSYISRLFLTNDGFLDSERKAKDSAKEPNLYFDNLKEHKVDMPLFCLG
jgi:hypothetical protein